jgi:hypothetical protein
LGSPRGDRLQRELPGEGNESPTSLIAATQRDAAGSSSEHALLAGTPIYGSARISESVLQLALPHRSLQNKLLSVLGITIYY